MKPRPNGLGFFCYILAEYKSIKNWADDDRPREKLAAKGRSALSNAELLAILIGSGTKQKSAVEVAREILNFANNDLNVLARLGISDLCKIDGIGPAKAITIIAAIELANRRPLSNTETPKKITSSRDAFLHLQPLLRDKNYEEFWILTLARNNKVLKPYRISEGGISGTVADPKRIFKAALDSNASAIILSHNHPSGNLLPSKADENLTAKIVNASKHLDIQILDHLIIAGDSYYSFADEGKI